MNTPATDNALRAKLSKKLRGAPLRLLAELRSAKLTKGEPLSIYST